ncbi:MAG: amino acid adenylation domain-containing protein, partial [Cyanothece sp. SIO2G6]|nr:amino acid adenylation domain-containing protein [Cyanothece sp. SIO2G6]
MKSEQSTNLGPIDQQQQAIIDPARAIRIIQKLTEVPVKKRGALLALLRKEGIDPMQLPIVPAPRKQGIIPLSFSQQRLWFLTQLDGQSALYNLPTVLWCHGSLKLNAFQQALEVMSQRHDILRTTIGEVNRTTVQIVHDQCHHSFHVEDWREKGLVGAKDYQAVIEDGLADELQEFIQRTIATPFDLATGPLIRTALVQLSDTDTILILNRHHIIWDGWSTGVFIQEVTAVYNACVAGNNGQSSFRSGSAPSNSTTSPATTAATVPATAISSTTVPDPATVLPPRSLQYADYALWQQQWFIKEAIQSQLTYWKQQLTDLPPLLPLPTDYPRPTVQRCDGATHTLALSAHLSQQVKQVAMQQQVTLFMVLLTALQVLLYRYSGQSDIAVGTPVSNRQRSQLETMIGFFVNTLVLRLPLQVTDTVTDVLQRVKQTTLDAFNHAEVPFDQVVEALQPQRSSAYSPLFQVMFVLQDDPTVPVVGAGVALTSLRIETRTAQFDLTLVVDDTAAGLVTHWEYNTDLFAATTVARMATHFETLLGQMVADMTQPIAKIPLLSAAERQQILVDWNESTPHLLSVPNRDSLVHQVFEAQVAQNPEAEALVFTTLATQQQPQRLTYGALNRRANQFAHYLQAQGVGPDVLVGLCLERSIDLVVGILAILKAGGAYVPLDPNYPSDRLQFMLDDAHISFLLTATKHLDALPSHNNQVICFDRDGDGAIATQPTDTPTSHATVENLAYVIYTSGSTGNPKGVMLHHAGLGNLAAAQSALFEVESGRRVLQFASISFDASVSEIFMALTTGATIVLADPPALMPGAPLRETLLQQQISHITLPPSVLAVMDTTPLPDLQCVIVAGEACPPELAQQWAKHYRLWNAYGPTEATVCATAGLVPPADSPQPLTIGYPIANVRVYILDEHLQPLPIGVTGELYIGGIGVAQGYLNRSELTADRFVTNPFGSDRLYKTGDLARYHANGQVEFLGRLDRQVKIRGFRIEQGEIESALNAHPQVRQGVVTTYEETGGTQALIAYWVAGEQADEGTTNDPVRQWLLAHLPSYMVPSVVMQLDTLPLTPNGKVDVKALPHPAHTDQPDPEQRDLPQTEMEKAIAPLFLDLLPIDTVGIHDNFFNLGGHSILATQLVARIKENLDLELPLRQVFETPVIAQLAAALAELNGAETGMLAITPRPQTHQPLPLSFAQERQWFLNQLEQDSGSYTISGAVKLEGVLDVAALQQTIDAIVCRHEILRTTFPSVNGTATQHIEPSLTIPLQIIDGGTLEQPLNQWLTQAGKTPFNLTTGPLLRVTLIQLPTPHSSTPPLPHSPTPPLPPPPTPPPPPSPPPP